MEEWYPPDGNEMIRSQYDREQIRNANVENDLRIEVASLRDEVEAKADEIKDLSMELEVAHRSVKELEQEVESCRQALAQRQSEIDAAMSIISGSDEKDRCMQLHRSVTKTESELKAEKSRNVELNKQLVNVKKLAVERIQRHDDRVKSARREIAQLSLDLHHARSIEEYTTRKLSKLKQSVLNRACTARRSIQTCQDIVGNDDGCTSTPSHVLLRRKRRLARELSRARSFLDIGNL